MTERDKEKREESDDGVREDGVRHGKLYISI